MENTRLPYILVLSLRSDLFDPSAWTDADRQAVGAHFAMLQREAAAGRILLAGRSDDHDEQGWLHAEVLGIAVFLASSREEAEAFAANDPAVLAGVMKVRVHQFNLAVHADAATWAAL
ncbi:MAG TPA: YciI family protein [Mesorhizobium sp.]